MGERAGPAAAAVLRLVSADSTAHIHVLALGLMLDVLYGTDISHSEVAQARHAWENGYRLPRVAPRRCADWRRCRERMRAVADTDPGSRQVVWRDTHEAFAVAAFPDGVAHSPSHPDGYGARLGSVADALSAGTGQADGGESANAAAHLGDIEAAAAVLGQHDLAWTDRRTDTERYRWQCGSSAGLPPTPRLHPRPARGIGAPHRGDGWVDRAVADVWSGSIHANVAGAYRVLCSGCSPRRQHDETFAPLLAAATERDILPTGRPARGGCSGEGYRADQPGRAGGDDRHRRA